MLWTEWDLDAVLTLRREEGREEGIAKGWQGGKEETARNALAEGASLEFVSKITGLDIETIARLQPST